VVETVVERIGDLFFESIEHGSQRLGGDSLGSDDEIAAVRFVELFSARLRKREKLLLRKGELVVLTLLLALRLHDDDFLVVPLLKPLLIGLCEEIGGRLLGRRRCIAVGEVSIGEESASDGGEARGDRGDGACVRQLVDEELTASLY
jgi:hypothetical protein